MRRIRLNNVLDADEKTNKIINGIKKQIKQKNLKNHIYLVILE